MTTSAKIDSGGPYGAILSDIKTFAKWGEYACIVFALVLFSGGLIDFLFSGLGEAARDKIVQVLWLPVYAGGAFLLCLHIRKVFGDIWLGWAAWLTVGLAFASTTWSIEPSVTLKKSIALLGSMLFVYMLSVRYNFRTIIRMLAIAGAVLSVTSLLVAVAMPSQGIMQVEVPGAWSGVWHHKNSLGGNMAFLAFFALIGASIDKTYRRHYFFLILLCLFLVIMSRSKTSLLLFMIATAGVIGIRAIQQSALAGVLALYGGIMGASIGGFVMAFAPQLFFAAIGKDQSLTGRKPLWAAIGERIEAQKMFGYGFGAFWHDPLGPSWFVHKAVHWNAPTAHHGWLDVWLQLGLVGVWSVAFIFIATALVGLFQIKRSPVAAFTLPCLVVMFIYSFSESVLVFQNNLVWMSFILATIYVWRETFKRHHWA